MRVEYKGDYMLAERRLGLYVIKRALQDVAGKSNTDMPSRAEVAIRTETAHQWLMDESPGLDWWCLVAGVDKCKLRKYLSEHTKTGLKDMSLHNMGIFL